MVTFYIQVIMYYSLVGEIELPSIDSDLLERGAI